MLVRFSDALWDSTFSVHPCWACTGRCSTNLNDVSLAKTPHPPYQAQFFFPYHRPRDIWSGRPAFSNNPARAVSPESSFDCYFWCSLSVVIHPWLSYPPLPGYNSPPVCAIFRTESRSTLKSPFLYCNNRSWGKSAFTAVTAEQLWFFLTDHS